MSGRWFLQRGWGLLLVTFGAVTNIVVGALADAQPPLYIGVFFLGCSFMGFLVEWADGWRV